MLFPSHFLYVFIKRLLSETLNLLLKKCLDAQAKEVKEAKKQTAFGGFLSGKTALGASSAEKALNKKYKFDGEAMSVAEFVERHANDDTLALSTSEVNKYKGASRSAWNRMSEAEQKADEERVKNSGTKTVYMVNGYDLGKTAYEYAQHLIEKGERRKQEGEKSLAGVVEGKIYKNNLAGGNAVAVVRGKSDGKVLVAYASDVEDAQNGLFMGEQVVSDSDMAQMLERGELAELKQETAGQSVNERIAQAEGVTNVAPTDGQKEVGNYKKGHVRVAGYDISIEQPKGSVRSGVDANGNKWEQTMHNTYGYFRGTEGVDGDHIDVFLANDMDAWNGEQVFVVDQYKEDGSFDEHKVMLGFDSIEDAQSAYLSNYKDGWADKHRIVVTGTNAADFKKWVDSSHRKTKAFADYKNVKKNEGQSGADNSSRDGVAADRTKEGGASLRSNLADFKEGDVVRDYYDKQLYRIKKHSKNGVSTIAMLDEDGNEAGTKQMNAHNNSRYSLAEPPVKAEAPTISHESEQVGDKDGRDGVAADGTKGSTRAKNERKSYSVGKQEKSKKSGRGSRMLGDYYDQEFEDGLANGHDVVREEHKTKGTIFDFTSKDKQRPALQGVFHNDGYAIATDSFVMVGRKDKYDAALDGKTINKKGEPITYEENGVVKDVKYPNWKIAVPQTTEPTGIDIDDLASVIEGIRIADGVKQDSQLIYPISIKTVDGKIISMPQGHLRRFLRGAKQVGATEVRVFISNHGSAILMAEGSKGFALAMGSKGVSDTSNSFYDAYTKDASSTAGSTDYNIADEALMAERGSEAFERATEHTIDALKAAGVEVVEATDAMVEEVLGLAEMHKQKKAPETASVQEEHQPTVVSSADGAKLLKDLDSAITEYENKSGQSKTFLGDIAQVLGATKHGSNSQYATFEAVNGKVFTIRLANHNAKVSNFDNHGENEGISIVITAQDNNGINNDGNAHVVEFFYDAIKLRKADGKPLVEILKSIKQALYSGEYKDTTGLAQAEEVNIPEFMQVYHGSGAKFDKFDHSYMGSGEGAQAFGWGTYVTEVEGIGRSYAENTSDNIFKTGFGDFYLKKIREGMTDGKSFEDIKQNLLDYHAHVYEQTGGDKDMFGGFISDYETLRSLKEEDLPKRNLYTVEIPDDTGKNYLYWYNGITDEQKKMIADAAQKEGIEFDFYGDKMNANEYFAEMGKGIEGHQLYVMLKRVLGSDKAASEFLNRIGFVGIKYPTESLSGGNKDGKSNYVIFNEADAKITDRVEFLRTADGVVYGWAVDGKIYLTKEGMNPNTPAHEYTHLWAQMVEKADPKLWGRIVDGLRGCATWNEVLNDKAYEGIWGDDSRMASEVLSRLTGSENYRREMARAQQEIADAKGALEKAEKISALEKVKMALRDFLGKVKSLIQKGERRNEKGETIRDVETDVPAWMEFVDMALGDLYGGVNPGESSSKAELMFIGEKGATAMDKAEEATTRLDNLAVAREMEAQGKDALAIKMATGWERGADGKWRYEVMDVKDFDIRGNIDFGKRHPEVLKEYERFRKLRAKKTLYAMQGLELSEAEQSELDSLSPLWLGTQLHNSRKLKDYVDAPELFAAYPELRDIKVRFENLELGSLGYYRPSEGKIGIKSTLDKETMMSVLNHEIQHAIQHIEGFARGGNIRSVKSKVDVFKEEARVLYDKMLETSEWAEKMRLQRRWFDETNESELAKIESRIEEIDNSGVLREIETMQSELSKKYGLDANVGKILSEPHADDAEIWEQLPESFYDKYDVYSRLAGEVEARNTQSRMDKSLEERRASLASETADVAQEDQIFIYEGLESAMGSRVDKRMADVAQHFADAELSERQRAIVDVFGGMRNNLPIRIERADGSTRRVVMRQGREDRGGTKHALLRHYGTSSGNYTADELLLIEDVLSVEPTHEQRRGVTVNVYQREIDGVRYTVVTEKNDRGAEVFADFYTNRSGNARSSNTQLSAQADSITASSEREVTENSVAEQNNGQKNVGAMDAATASQRTGQEDDGDTLFSYKPFGGNSGYVGYSMSKRAAQARAEGRFPKTDFKKEYGVTERVLDALVEAGIVDNAEWHHTSMYGNRTPFYGWVDDSYAEIYAANKEAVKNIAMGKDASGKTLAAMPAENPYTEMAVRIPEGWYPFVNSLDDSLTEDERDAALMERFGDAYAQMKVASENNRLYHEFEANKGRMERAQREERGERLRAFFEERAATASQLTGRENAATPSQRTGQDGETVTGLRGERGADVVNARFNAELDRFTENNADSVVFNLGEPSSILQAAGVVNKNMKLYGSKVAMKMKKHGFEASELRDLPNAIANPIAVFNNYNKDGNRSILTELHTAQGNFLVTLSVGKGQDIDFNIVSSVFGKGENNIINWLNNGYATYINKEKALNYLHLATPIVAASNNQELVSATKLVESFENPQILEQENDGDTLFSVLDKQAYEGRRRYADNKNAENKRIGTANGLTEEQADLLEELTAIRHELHTSKESHFNGNSDILKRLVDLNSRMNDAGIAMSFIPTDESDFIDIDDINVLSEIDDNIPENGTDEYKDWYADEFSRVSEELEDLNSKIEGFLGNIDATYGTSYKPGGYTRFYRKGERGYTDDAVSDANDLIGKALGKRRYGAKQRVAYAERVRRSMVRVAGRLAKDLHLDNVDIVTDVNELPEGKKRGAKGFYSKSTGRITIVVPNHVSTYDIEQTVLHEAVAHYGLRKLFGAHFDTFLDNVFENAEGDVRRSILELAKKNGWDFRTATEEYLASLAEDTDFENAASSVHGWWVKLKRPYIKNNFDKIA